MQTLVLIPALNEADCLGPTISHWRALGAARVRVVDNGSADDTRRVALHYGAELLNEPQRGYGAAVWRGLQSWPSDCPWVLFSSADGSDRLTADDVGAWQDAIDAGADLIIGDRVSRGSARRHLKPIQRLGNWVLCLAIERGWGRRFRDIGSLRVIRRSALERLNLRDRAFGWNVEMQVRAIELGLDVRELPVDYFPRSAGRSKISGSFTGTIKASVQILSTLHDLWVLRRNCRRVPAGASQIAPKPMRTR